MNSSRKSNILYGFLAFVFSLILFFNANGRNVQTTLNTNPENFEETVNKVQIHPVYDSDKYYILGFDPYVSVKLNSANRIQLNAEANPDTRGFRVVCDLTGLGEGTHEVKLRIQNGSSAVGYTISPAKVTVTIEKKVTKSFKINPVVSSSNLGEGFSVDSITVEPEEAQITTGEKTLAEIDRVVATVDPSKTASADFEEKATIEALDKEGNRLSVISDPTDAQITVKVKAPEKTVSLYASQVGTVPTGISHYDFKLDNLSTIIRGPQSKLDGIESIAVPVDITNISEKTTREVAIPTETGVVASPKTIKVEITPVRNTTNTQTTTTSTAPATSSSEEVKETTTASSEQTSETTESGVDQTSNE
ncbi:MULTISPECIES: CdaR family protein [Enterococcus]|jgi:YbbR domain-containing protein|uniref:YbbR-like protein n=2 Tax=Enterococcus dispar TaxID=44009 RepID=S1N805_9ENTE|nr:CdaR family protein [Enterococcus dispar]EOT43375.1 hypothetical protein OMK_00730 [Enterococcus dispar ATCC 51266]EOW85177.1 hypothetical protein I569_00470 [Enterococcus dispar ATCC 51266]MCU7358387.1 CdaR family protein [Enterococcus dispar]MDT2706547.1 CdaR family protein [Enterococcus dispar]WCG33252.1 CdaR family protein [Enterococcus dispar]